MQPTGMLDPTEITFLVGEAETGDVAAQLTLADMYENGYGLARNMGLAAQCFLQAAEQGSVQAQARIGAAYLNGVGVSQDYDKAYYWLRLAAGQKNPDAIAELGWCYQTGRGTARDYAKVSQCYERAAALGHAGAPAPTGHEIGATPLPGVLKGTDIEDSVTAPPPTGSGVCSRSVGEISRRILPKSLAATSTHPDCITGLGMRLVLSEMRLRSRIS